MPDTPQHTDSNTEMVEAEDSVSLENQTDTVNPATPEPASVCQSQAGFGAIGNAANSFNDFDDDEEEVMGGGCVFPRNVSMATKGSSENDSLPYANGTKGKGKEETNGGIADSTNHLALISETLVSPASQIEASSLIPPSLKDPSTAYGVLLSNQKDVQLDAERDTFDSIYPETTDDTTDFDDSCQVSSSDDYAAVAREAHSYWRARLKQSSGILEQAAADIRDFMAGTERRRLRLVLTQIHDLIDKTPKVYELLE
ncbi:hypothetical protein LPJ73_003165, partial [Coemansia sp. RSA 2703]